MSLDVQDPPNVPRVVPSRELTLPAWRAAVVDDGLEAVAASCGRTPLFSVALNLSTDSSTPALVAAAEVVAGLIANGTTSTGPVQDWLADRGCTMSASCSSRGLSIWASGPSERAAEVLHFLAARLADPWSEDDFHRLRQQMVAQVKVISAQPSVMIRALTLDHLYGSRPDLVDVPSATELLALDAEFVRNRCAADGRAPGRMVLIGDRMPEELLALAADAFAGRGAVPPPVSRPLRIRPVRGVRVHRLPGLTQSQVRLVAPGPRRDDPAFPAAALATAVMGGYFSSRLVLEIRERRGMAYRVAAAFEDHLDNVVLAVDLECAAEVTERAVAAVVEVLGDMTRQPPGPLEIDRAREHMVGSAALSVSSHAALCANFSASLSIGQRPDDLAAYTRRLRSLTDAEVLEAADNLFRPGNFAGVALTGPAGPHRLEVAW